jgi:hypothetical protein
VEGGARRIRSGEALWIIRQDSKPVHCSHAGPLVYFAPSPSHTIHFLFSENFGARMKKLMLTIALMVNGSVSAQTWRADNGDGTFSNPLFYDEFSDPDLIRVGEDYYLTGATMHSMPGDCLCFFQGPGELKAPRLCVRPFRPRTGVPVGRWEGCILPGHLGAMLSLSQRGFLHLLQRQPALHATVPRQESFWSLDSHRAKSLLPQPLSPLRYGR